ncbi:MAG TPA: hypothetical protein PLJ78_09500 [Anaerolineae bacterium]|nr:hypothetical protein [Anaerolineae bacterium]HQK14162.1 hypothetical protein [Anaerolineae bacterium]
MARFDRMTVLNRIMELGLVPVFYHADAVKILATENTEHSEDFSL